MSPRAILLMIIPLLTLTLLSNPVFDPIDTAEAEDRYTDIYGNYAYVRSKVTGYYEIVSPYYYEEVEGEVRKGIVQVYELCKLIMD